MPAWLASWRVDSLGDPPVWLTPLPACPPCRGKPKIVDLTSQRRLADKVGRQGLTCACLPCLTLLLSSRRPPFLPPACHAPGGSLTGHCTAAGGAVLWLVGLPGMKLQPRASHSPSWPGNLCRRILHRRWKKRTWPAGRTSGTSICTACSPSTQVGRACRRADGRVVCRRGCVPARAAGREAAADAALQQPHTLHAAGS